MDIIKALKIYAIEQNINFIQRPSSRIHNASVYCFRAVLFHLYVPTRTVMAVVLALAAVVKAVYPNKNRLLTLTVVIQLANVILSVVNVIHKTVFHYWDQVISIQFVTVRQFVLRENKHKFHLNLQLRRLASTYYF